MKVGSSLQSVAQRVSEQQRSVRDFLASMNHIRVHVADAKPLLVLNDGTGSMPFDVSDSTHEQIANALDIPLPYYRRLREDAPELLASNINTWLSRGSGRRLIRTMRSQEGTPLVRAF